MHLFFSFSRSCWRFLNIQWDYNLQIMDMIIAARVSFNSNFFREIVMVACWALSTHRNEVIFGGVALSLRR
ncbi:hypothetical protein HU200_017021 [Digitaria exilis]|uniref:Uncharacterized protein n=1 Tax=Digitaria exilis TaxID=1010633 RepID=A0A835KGJ0_9POAL|nr:hypothetical protein HU200_017021 [Digitaria exilis]